MSGSWGIEGWPAEKAGGAAGAGRREAPSPCRPHSPLSDAPLGWPSPTGSRSPVGAAGGPAPVGRGEEAGDPAPPAGSRNGAPGSLGCCSPVTPTARASQHRASLTRSWET